MTDSFFISIAIIAVLVLLPAYVVGLITSSYKKNREEKENLPSGNPSNDAEDTAGNVSNAEREPMQILISSLREINAEYEITKLDHGGEIVYFTYQAESFSAELCQGSCSCHLIDPIWYSFDASDYNELSIVKKTINEVNWLSPVNVVYQMSEDEKQYHVTTSYVFFLIDGIPYPDYLLNILRNFFRTQNTFFRMLAEEHGKNSSSVQ